MSERLEACISLMTMVSGTLSLSGMNDLCTTDYVTVNQGCLISFIKIWHTKTLLFHLPLGEMSITHDNKSSLLHLSIRGKILDHGKIRKDEALELMVDYLGVSPEVALREMEKTREAHARFEFLENVYIDELFRVEQTIGNDEHVGLHIAYPGLMWMSSTYDISRTLSGSMSTTEGRLFGLLEL